MRTVVNLFHPNLAASRVNARLARAAAGVEGVEVRDLYALYPDFRIDAAAEQAAIEDADRIVWQFPMYWFSSPALLKQWEDDVLQYGWAYGSSGKALVGKELLLAVSPGASPERYTLEGVYGHPVEDLLAPFKTVTTLTGLTWAEPFITLGASQISEAQIDAQAARYAARLAAPLA